MTDPADNATEYAQDVGVNTRSSGHSSLYEEESVEVEGVSDVREKLRNGLSVDDTLE